MSDLVKQLRACVYTAQHDDDLHLFIEAADEIQRLQAELELIRGAMAADDERLRAAAARASVTDFGCDTADHLADRILEQQAVVDAARLYIKRQGDDLLLAYLIAAIRAYDGEVKPCPTCKGMMNYVAERCPDCHGTGMVDGEVKP
jgi:hypothetical protein